MKFADAHTDFLTELKDEKLKNYVKSLGKNFVCSAIFSTNKNLKLKDIIEYKNLIEKLNTTFKSKLIFSIEDAGFLLESEWEKFAILKPFSTTLTWNKTNQFAGGALDKGGLTSVGKNFIEFLNKNNILADTVHLNRKSFYEVVKRVKGPIYCSHTNLDALHRHKRNLTNNQIDCIVRSGGFVGLTFYKDFVTSKNFSAKEIALQFDYFIKHFGYKNVGLGTDFFGIEKQKLPKDLRAYTDLTNLKKELKLLGYSNKVISHIMWKNFYNFIKKAKKPKPILFY